MEPLTKRKPDDTIPISEEERRIAMKLTGRHGMTVMMRMRRMCMLCRTQLG